MTDSNIGTTDPPWGVCHTFKPSSTQTLQWLFNNALAFVMIPKENMKRQLSGFVVSLFGQRTKVSLSAQIQAEDWNALWTPIGQDRGNNVWQMIHYPHIPEQAL